MLYSGRSFLAASSTCLGNPAAGFVLLGYWRVQGGAACGRRVCGKAEVEGQVEANSHGGQMLGGFSGHLQMIDYFWMATVGRRISFSNGSRFNSLLFFRGGYSKSSRATHSLAMGASSAASAGGSLYWL